MSSCLLIGAVALSLGSPDFTLGWTHSVEKVGWVESWRVEGQGLRLTRVAIKGSGAGMEPADDARLEDGWWVWNPENTVLPGLVLAASGATGAGWQLCSAISLRPCTG